METDEEKKRRVFEAAHALFSAVGYRQTSVSDIMHRAGFAVGSFYRYYDSKEAAFLEVYIAENRALKARLFEGLDTKDSAGGAPAGLPPDPVEFVAEIVSRNAREMLANPVLREWYNRDLFGRLERMFAGSDEMARLQAEMNEGQLEMIREWKAAGMMRTDLEDATIQAMFRAIPFIDLHKDEIGADHFPDLMKHIAAAMLRGLRP